MLLWRELSTRRVLVRLLVTASTFPASLDDGSPRFVFDLARAISKSANVSVHAPSSPRATDEDNWHGVEIRRFTYFWPRRLQRLTPSVRDNLRTSLLAKIQVVPFMVASFWSLRRQIKATDAEVVNAHWLVPQGLVAALLKVFHGDFKLLLHVHAGDVDFLSSIPVGRALARFVVGRSDGVFTAAAHVTARLENLTGRSTGARSRPMGVDWEAFAKERPPARYDSYPNGFVLFAGRIVEKKGVHVLIDAFPSFIERHPGVGLVVAGDGPLKDELVAYVASIGLEEAIYFAGPLDHDDLARHLGSCRVAVIPSVVDQYDETEGTPTILIEAMAAGAPIVASEVAGVPDVIRHGENGWLCRPGDPIELASTLTSALEAVDLADVKNQARQDARTYSWDQVASDYLAAIAEL